MDPQLEQYIKAQLVAGFPPEQIKQALVSSGHSPQDAEVFVNQVLSPPAIPPAPPPHATFQPTPVQQEPPKMQPQQMPAVKKPSPLPAKWDYPIPKWAVITAVVIAASAFMFVFYKFMTSLEI